MHPILFHVGSYPVSAYGVALLLAFALGIELAARRAPGQGLKPEVVYNAGIVILVSSLLGARAFYAITHLAEFRPPVGNPLDVINPFREGSVGIGGLSMTGGVILAVLAAVAYLGARGGRVLRYCDVLVPSVALGEAITRIGCFLNGCCFGRACAWPWGVVYPAGTGPNAMFGGLPVHPAPLYTSALSLAAFVLFSWLLHRHHTRGTVFFAFLVVTPGIRVLVDTFRFHDEGSSFAFGSTPVPWSSALCLGLMAVGVMGLVWVRGQARRAAP